MAAVTPSAIYQKTYVCAVPPATDADAGHPRFKVGYVYTGATVDDTDTITVDMYASWGITKFLGIIGYIHTTIDSVIAEEAPTTTVDREKLTITVGGSTDNKKRFYVVYGI